MYKRQVIDRCVRQMYREHLQDPETSKMPTLQTLYDLLCSQPEGEAVRLATALEIYVSGSLNVCLLYTSSRSSFWLCMNGMAFRWKKC